MKLYIDTANIEDIKKANEMGVISGVTTNPTLIAKEGKIFEKVINEIADIVHGPIHGEVKASSVEFKDIVNDGRSIAQIHKNMVVKIPMTSEGLKAVKILKKEGIKTNMTLVFTANQAILAAEAGADYVTPFIGRLDDIDIDGLDLIKIVSDIFHKQGYSTKVLAASIRNPIHVTRCALAGSDIATIPYSVIEQMVRHPLTDSGIIKFRNDYDAVFGK